MIVECKKCQTQFRLKDEMITGIGVKVRCQKCGEVIIVKNPFAKETPFEPSPTPPAPDSTELDSDVYDLSSVFTDQPDSSPPDSLPPDSSPPAPSPPTPSAGKDPFDEFDLSDFEDPSKASSTDMFGDIFQEDSQAKKGDFDIEGGVGDSADDLKAELDRVSREFYGDPLDSEEVSPEKPEEFERPFPEQVELGEDFRKEAVIESKEEKLSPSKTALWLLITVLLGVVIYFFFYKEGAPPGVRKPEHSTSPAVKDTGGVQSSGFTLRDLQGYFAKGDGRTGRTFIISGKVLNSTPPAKSFVRIKGSLFDQNNQLLSEKDVYCGNVFTREELDDFTMEEIEKQLQVKLGRSLINMNIKPDRNVPFMIVFFDVPEDVVSFRVDVVDWQKSTD